MSESTETQLKVIVERAVRPVRASVSHKRKMREELLAHVGGVFEEESAKLGDERAALERTVERFGNPAEVTAQWNESVPAGDWFVRWIEYVEEFRPGESVFRRAVRLGAMMVAVFGGLVIPVFLLKGRFSEWPIIPASGALIFCFTFLNHWMRNALCGPNGRSWVRAVLVALIAAIPIPGATFVLCFLYLGNATSSLQMVLPLLPSFALLSWLPVTVMAVVADIQQRYRREWDGLELN